MFEARLLPALFALAFAVTLCSCSLLESDEENAEMRIAFGFSEKAASVLDTSAVSFSARVDEQERTRTLGRAEFSSQTDYRYDTESFETATSGTAHVSCTLFVDDSSNEGTATTETIELELREDFRYGVDCLVSSDNPYNMCLGCFGYQAAALPSSLGFPESDTLFVVWSGNSIENPVIY